MSESTPSDPTPSDSGWLDPGWPEPAPVWRQPPGARVPAAPPAGEDAALDFVLDATGVVAPVRPEPELPVRACAECGGEVDADGYCTQCGAKAPRERDHVEETPAPWVGAVSDRGLRHRINEDAIATAADPEPGSRAVLVVCDGVSQTPGSDVAALAAARAARDVLAAARPEAANTPASLQASMTALFTLAAAAANDAVAANTVAGSVEPAACTLALAVVEGGQVFAGTIGDSRVYWLGDGPGQGLLLTCDDSVAAENIAAGVPRRQAEEGAGAHTITRWLGIDAQDVIPRVTSAHLPGPGWVLVCSDGLWNDASEPATLRRVLTEVIAEVGAAIPAPIAVARGLVAWANTQGGHDNISVALARVGTGIADLDGPADELATAKTPAPGAAPSRLNPPTG